MTALRASLLQQPLVWHDPAGNRERFEALLEPLAGRTDLVVLPETFTTGFSMEAQALAEPPGGPTTEWLARWAARLGAPVTRRLLTRGGRRRFNPVPGVAPPGGQAPLPPAHPFP